jgi:hypothetical protein
MSTRSLAADRTKWSQLKPSKWGQFKPLFLHHVSVIELHTGEVLSRHDIEPDKSYWRNKDREPGRWPSSQK